MTAHRMYNLTCVNYDTCQNRMTTTTIDGPVLDVISHGHCKGGVFYLPDVQLERALYEAANEVLTRIGGKWNRKARGHVFDVDCASLIDLVLASSEMPPKNPTAYFPTPEPVAVRLLTDHRLLGIPVVARCILEPSAGAGHLADVVRGYAPEAEIDVCEVIGAYLVALAGKGYRVVADDFLDYRPEPIYDAVVMNPPFAVEGDPLAYVTHVEHAWSLLRPRGVLLAVLPAGFIFREVGRAADLRNRLLDHWGTWIEVEAGAFRESGTDVRTVLVSAEKP
jgi:hypothetical protein